MCIAIPGQIATIRPDHPHLAEVEVEGVRRTVNVGMLDAGGLKPGDWVLIHAGFAMATMEEAEALDALAFLAEIDQAYDDELVAFEPVGGEEPWSWSRPSAAPGGGGG